MSSTTPPPFVRPSSAPRRTLLAPAPGERLRRARGYLFEGLCAASSVVVLVPLFLIFLYVVSKGLSGLSLDFFTQLPKPVGEAGSGMGNAVLGTLILIAIGSCIGLPTGILAGIYLAEIGRGKLASAIRFIADVLGGVPSITIGVFVYALVVVTMKRFSALAGGIALAIVMLPTVTRTTEELLKLVPAHLREASLALGVPEWRTSLFVVLRTASPGIGTGVMLAVARISGETAPVLLTALGSPYWSAAIDQPIASLPVQIWRNATSPYATWQQEAWTGALVLIAIVFFLSLLARIATSRSVKAR
ncbi:phosphate ABC transporter permease PstA [Sorangium sp. So ce233]|uniref:phosphate ABC transporter permease PstA n=1 Tax=Sorangium sp. So ce233 TaxID=3133290 RepID=UPI003F5F4EBE